MKHIIAVPLIFFFDGIYSLYLLKGHDGLHCFSEYEIKPKEGEIPKEDADDIEKIVRIFYDQLYHGIYMAATARGFSVGSKSISLVKTFYNTDTDTLYVYFSVECHERPQKKDPSPYREVFVPVGEVYRRIVDTNNPLYIDIGVNILKGYFEEDGKWLLPEVEKI